MDERRTDTRDRIRAVALELFTTRGYERTSLREIAEHLGVTKAAVYYHFKSKEDIVGALVGDFLRDVEAIVSWARDREPTLETRREVIRRYAAVLRSRGAAMLLFLQQNEPALQHLPVGARLEERKRALVRVLTVPGASLTDQLRSRMSVFALHAGIFMTQDLAVTDEERWDAALHTALDLLTPDESR